jgi:hypothetical protein
LSHKFNPIYEDLEAALWKEMRYQIITKYTNRKKKQEIKVDNLDIILSIYIILSTLPILSPYPWVVSQNQWLF